MGVAEMILAGEDEGPEFGQAVDAADVEEVAAVVALWEHPDADVRLLAVQEMPILTHGEPPTADMLDAVVRLTADADARVRDWATFALGCQWGAEVDTDEVRSALLARLDDDDDEARCEALVGLAIRRDARALPHVRAALTRESGDVWILELEAAGALGDPGLHELVLRHVDGWDEPHDRRAAAAARLTDPAGLGDDLLDGVAELCRRRAHGRVADDAGIGPWQDLNLALELAPHRAREAFDAVLARLAEDPEAVEELRRNSALAQLAGELVVE